MHPVDETHRVDADNNPAGGHTSGRGFEITWQDGPLAIDGIRREPNGAFVEDIILAAIGRIQFYQNSKFHCLHNAVALGHLFTALTVLQERTAERTDRGVEGTNQV